MDHRTLQSMDTVGNALSAALAAAVE